FDLFTVGHDETELHTLNDVFADDLGRQMLGIRKGYLSSRVANRRNQSRACHVFVAVALHTRHRI
ncbi:MAG TPA: hypothetical protein VD789_10505, partial [Thermomicrobiales bacterium]|nr:hypothetical protein [Thermomicrobiales bacterium]